MYFQLLRILTISFIILFHAGSIVAQYPANIKWADALLGISSEQVVSFRTKQSKGVQALGIPNVLPCAGPSYCAWSPASQNNPKGEWIKVGFEEARSIRQVAVAESFNPGSIQRIVLYDEEGEKHTVYEIFKINPVAQKGRMLNVILEEMTPYKVVAVEVIMNTSAVKGWNHIDAIGTSDMVEPIEALIHLDYDEDRKINKVTHMDAAINTPYDEVFPVVSPDGNTLYFTRKDHPENIGTAHNDDIWVSRKMEETGWWSSPVNMGSPLNDYNHNYVCAAPNEGNTLLLGNQYHRGQEATSGISISHFLEGKWSYPEALKIDGYHNHSSFSEYSMSIDGNVMLMAIEANDSHGDRDLYVSFRQDNNTWTTPMNLGAEINSASTELTPFLAADGRSLFFASMGYSGFGLADLYMSYRLDDSWQHWSSPVNLGPRVNSADWESGYTMDKEGKQAFFVSYKSGNHQHADLFQIDREGLLGSQWYKVKMDKIILVKDQYTGELLSSRMQLKQDTTLINVLEGAAMTLHLAEGIYEVVLQAKGYWGTSRMFRVTEQDAATDTLEVLLQPLEEGMLVNLKSVLFERTKATLLPSSYRDLHNLIGVLSMNENIKILLEGHTDTEGNPRANLYLSRKRVEMVKRYLIKNGVEEERIDVKAFGGQRPLTSGRSEQDKQKNRRVEVRLLGNDTP
ncbi:OmpA family protein [Algivirga pacifica]|uniref:OmpA-like domain-containing protein n=1 Tax=Algivirga pacifica TaxID=1162670 RepID=A0ABP9D5H3_9BACT